MKNRIFLYSLIFIALYSVQYIFAPLTLNGVGPEYILCGVVSISMFERQKFGAIYGLVFGLLSDFSSGGLFGINALIYMILGYTVGYLVSYLLSVNVFTCFLMSTVTLIVRDFITVVLTDFVHDGNIGQALLKVCLPKLILTMPLTVLTYFVFKLIGTNRKWRSYSEEY